MKIHHEIADIFDPNQTRTFKKKSVIFDSTSDVDGLYMMVSGQIKVTIQGDGDTEYTLNNIGPGDPFPMPLYFQMKEPKLRYIAETDVKAVWRPRREVNDFFYEHPSVLYQILQLVFSVLYGRINTLARGSAEEKVLRRILELAERWGNTDDDQFELKTTQQEIADSVGLSRESVNQMLNKLEDKGVLTTSRNKIYVNVSSAKTVLDAKMKCSLPSNGN